MTTNDTSSHETSGSRAISYEQFGVGFFEHAVTEERILGVLSEMLNGPIEVGPIGAGPGRLAKVAAVGAYGTPVMERIGDQPLEFRLTIPVSVSFTLDLRVETQRFNADLLVPLILRATAAEPLKVVIEASPPSPSDLTVKVKAEGLRATVVQKVADVDHELRMFLAKYVARELKKPYVEEALTIDIAALMDQAWASVSRSG